MLDHSISIFRLQAEPVLLFETTQAGPRIRFEESGEAPRGADFYIRPEHSERVKRAIDAFQREMQREPIEHKEAAE